MLHKIPALNASLFGSVPMPDRTLKETARQALAGYNGRRSRELKGRLNLPNLALREFN